MVAEALPSAGQLFLKGLILGFPVAVIPGPFLETVIAEARRHGFLSCLTVWLYRIVLELPLFLAILLAITWLPGDVQAPWALWGTAMLLGGWGWYLIDHPSHLSLRLDASYERLRSTDPTYTGVRLLRRAPHYRTFWFVWLLIASRLSLELQAGLAPGQTRADFLRDPTFHWRAAELGLGYYLPAVLGALWFTFALRRRTRMRQGDFFILPNRPYRMVVSLGGMFLLFLAFDYAVRGLGRVLKYSEWSVLG